MACTDSQSKNYTVTHNHFTFHDMLFNLNTLKYVLLFTLYLIDWQLFRAHHIILPLKNVISNIIIYISMQFKSFSASLSLYLIAKVFLKKYSHLLYISTMTKFYITLRSDYIVKNWPSSGHIRYSFNRTVKYFVKYTDFDRILFIASKHIILEQLLII